MLSASQGSLEGGQRHSSSPGLPQLPIRPWAHRCFSEPPFPHLNHEEVVWKVFLRCQAGRDFHSVTCLPWVTRSWSVEAHATGFAT